MDGLEGFAEVATGPWKGEIAVGWAFSCSIPDCKSIAHIERPDGALIPSERARELAYRNGWDRLLPGVWLCPQHLREF